MAGDSSQGTSSSSDFPLLANATQQEASKWGLGSVEQDEFYRLPDGTAAAEPGSLLKLEEVTDASKFDLAPGTALSRFIYQTTSYTGARVPATAYLLWPYLPRRAPDGGIPVVAWAHGTSGIYANAAPSHDRNLQLHFGAPYALALDGYAVVAPDYAGLGIDRDARGRPLVHEFLCHPSNADDLVYAVQAARSAFDGTLSASFVAAGHSQGGGVAWGVAERQARKPVDGYLGAVAVCPVTDMLRLENLDNPLIPCLAAYTAPTLARLYARFREEDFFTPLGLQRWKAYEKLRGGVPVAIAMLVGDFALMRDWKANEYFRDYIGKTHVGGKAIGGPLLVVQGAEDPNISANVTRAAVAETERLPGSQLKYLELPGMQHDSTLYAAQRVWLEWIAKRFAGEAGIDPGTAEALARPVEHYKVEPDWYVTPVKGPFDAM